MKKIINNYKNYKSISKNEMELIDIVEPILVFSPSFVHKFTGWKMSKINNTLMSLKSKGIIISLKKNSYVIASKINENTYKIASLITSPSYVSFWTACSLHGLTEQHLNTIQVVSTKQFPNITIGDFNIESTCYKKERFYGYQDFNQLPIAEKEKLIVDMLYKPEKAGGLNEVKKCIKASWKDINQKKLLSYLKKFNNKSLFSRLGFLLEDMELKSNIIPSLQKNLPDTYVRLNPQNPYVKSFDNRWKVIINDK